MQQRLKNLLLSVILILLPITSSLGIDMYLPAFSNIAESLHVPEDLMNLSMSVYLLGLAFGQLFYGVLSDRFGRRMILLIGMGIFTVASYACFMAHSFSLFFIARGVQALGACSAIVITRAIIADWFGHTQRTRMLALVNAMNIISPGIAPSLGGYLLYRDDWQAIFLSIGLFGLVLWILTFFLLPETLAPAQRRVIEWQSLKQSARRLFSSRYFMGYLMGIALMYATVFVWVNFSQDVLIQQLHVPYRHFGHYFILPAIGATIGALFIVKCVSYFSPKSFLTVGYSTVLSFAVMLALLSLTVKHLNPYEVVLPVFFIFLANGFIQPLQINAALSPFLDIAGFTTGVIGCMQGLAGALIGLLTTLFYHASFSAMGWLMLATALIAAIGFFCAERSLASRGE